jgi:tryptophan-rich sensory protein
VIGAAYYAICFVVLYRLFMLPSTSLRNVALSLILIVLVANALWNYLFFRLQNLRLSSVEALAYSLVTLGLLTLLVRLDRVAAWCLLPYALYLSYANWWGFAVWQANANSAEDQKSGRRREIR